MITFASTLTCFDGADSEAGSEGSKSNGECSNPAAVKISSSEWANIDEGINSMECEHPTSNDLRHLHEVEPDFSIDVNGWWRGPYKGDEGCTNGSARW